MTNSVLAGAKSIGQHLFGGYAELLRIPHTARFSVGSVIACMPFPMVGMTITISRSEERRVGKERRSRWSPYH